MATGKSNLNSLISLVVQNTNIDRERLNSIIEDIRDKIRSEELNYISAGKVLINSFETLQKNNKQLIEIINILKDLESNDDEEREFNEDASDIFGVDVVEGAVSWQKREVKQ